MYKMNIRAWHTQIAITLVPFLVLSAIFPAVAWVCVIFIFQGIELVTGYRAPLVGERGGIDPGAILVTALYLSLCAVIVKVLLNKQLRISAFIIGVGSLFLIYYVFSLVSSIIWF